MVDNVKLLIADCISKDCNETDNAEEIGNYDESDVILALKLTQALSNRYPATNKWAIFTNKQKGHVLEFVRDSGFEFSPTFSKHSVEIVKSFKERCDFQADANAALEKFENEVLNGTEKEIN